MSFKYVSLFSGIGGFEQALNKLGGTCVMASEINKFANQSYEILYGHKTVGDITKVEAKDVPDHDLLVGGFPCQAFSTSGKRLGFEDTRGTLFFEVARIAKEKQPKALVLENVKGLLSHNHGKTLDVIIQTLNDIGYTTDFDVLNSKYFGVPQSRERVFITAIRDDLVAANPWQVGGNDIVSKSKRRIGGMGLRTFNFDFPSCKEVTTKLIDIIEGDIDDKYYYYSKVGKSEDCVSRYEDGFIDSLPLEKDRNAIVKQLTEEICGIVSQKIPTHGLGICFKRGGDIRPHKMDARKSGISELCVNYENNPSSTLTTTHAPKVYGDSTNYRIRKLTPRECFRLQGFPDPEFDKLVEGGISNAQLYKQAGNAVTVNVVSAIGKRLLPYLK